jgi:hypothetical protein
LRFVPHRIQRALLFAPGAVRVAPALRRPAK